MLSPDDALVMLGVQANRAENLTGVIDSSWGLPRMHLLRVRVWFKRSAPGSVYKSPAPLPVLSATYSGLPSFSIRAGYGTVL